MNKMDKFVCSRESKFPSQEMFNLLLKARDGIFDPSIPKRPSASPIDINLPAQCFYVFAEEKCRNARGRAAENEICVKYNNCARSRVWWSPEHNRCLGMVARKMGMKARSANTAAANAANDPGGRHGFEGHWLALVERPSPGPIKDKTVIRTYILDKAPSLVQFWHVMEKKRPSSAGLAVPRHLVDGASPDSATSHAIKLQSSADFETKLGSMPDDPHHYEAPFDEFGLVEPAYGVGAVDPGTAGLGVNGQAGLGDASAFPVAPDDRGLGGRTSAAASLASPLPSAPLPHAPSAPSGSKSPAYQHLDENSDVLQDSDFYAPKRARSDNGNPDASREGPHEETDEDVGELSFLVDVLDEKDQLEALYGASASAPGSGFSPRASSLRRASSGSSAPAPVVSSGAAQYGAVDGPTTGDRGSAMDASLVAYEIFRSVCETFTAEEFRRWYDLYARTLFLPNVARGLKYFLDRGDPRLRPDFMFTSNCMFLPDVPVGTVKYSGSYARGFKVVSVGDQLKELLNFPQDYQSTTDLYEQLIESKMMLLCQHLYFKQMVAQGELDPRDYWFHTIVKLDNGKRMVTRGYSRVESSWGSVDEEIRTLQLQDVSEAYGEILDLPPLPC